MCKRAFVRNLDDFFSGMDFRALTIILTRAYEKWGRCQDSERFSDKNLSVLSYERHSSEAIFITQTEAIKV